jgi:hypothetical protein
LVLPWCRAAAAAAVVVLVLQLPPLVLDSRAAAGGLGVSLFRQLCEGRPEAVVVLRQQYRMCRAVMGLANELVYGGQLQPGSKAVEDAQLLLPRAERLQQVGPWGGCLWQGGVLCMWWRRLVVMELSWSAAAGVADGPGGGLPGMQVV